MENTEEIQQSEEQEKHRTEHDEMLQVEDQAEGADEKDTSFAQKVKSEQDLKLEAKKQVVRSQY